MIKSKRRILTAVFCLTALLCFSAFLLINKPVKANAENQSYELSAEDGTAKTGLYAGTGQSGASFTAVGYSANKQMLYINGFTDKKAAVIAFPEIDTNDYIYMDLLVYKNVNYGITLSVFKNDGEYTASSVANNSYPFTNAGGESQKGYVRINISELAGPDGKISSLVIRHETSDTTSQVSGFALNILSAVVQPYNDYTLKVDGIDMVNGQSALGAEFVSLTVHQPTGKLYANGYVRGSAVSLKFGAPVDSNFYKTLELNMCFYNMGTAYDFYIEGYKYGTADISAATPAGLLYVKHNPQFNKPGSPYVLKINLEDFADENGFVNGIILYHLFDERETDLISCSLYIFESYVKKAKDASVENKVWPSEVEEMAYTKNAENGKDRLVITFDAPLFTSGEGGITADDKFASDFANRILFNGTELVKGDIYEVVTAYDGSPKKLALLIDGKIENDAKDVVQYKSGATFTASCPGGNIKVFSRENREYIFSRPLADGETLTLSVYSYVRNVSAEYSDNDTVIHIQFNLKIGDLVGNPLENIFIGSAKLSEYATVTYRVSESDQSTLSISVPDSAGLLDVNGNSVLTVKAGFTTEFIYTTDDAVYEQKGAGNAYWFRHSEKPVYVLWLEGFKLDNAYGRFSIKLSDEYSGDDIAGYNISTFDKIKINGKALSGILKEDDGAQVVLRGAYLDVYVSATGYEHCLTATASDRITVEEGFAVPYGGTVDVKSEFVYDPLWREFKHVTDISEIKERITEINVKMVETDEASDKITSLMVTFSEPISYRFYPYVNRHPANLSKVLKGFTSTNPSDLYISQLSKYGVIDSTLDKIVFDGKTLRAWLAKDRPFVSDWQSLIDVRFLGAGIGFEDKIQIYISPDSSAFMDKNKTHTIEIKEGFITPNLQVLSKTVAYSWDVANERWIGIKTISQDIDVPESGGCGSAVTYDAWILSAVVVVLGGAVLTAKKVFGKKA